MGVFRTCRTEPAQSTCEVCGRRGTDIAEILGVCRDCIVSNPAVAKDVLVRSRVTSRRGLSAPATPPRTAAGATCRICANHCSMGPGELGFCGLRENIDGRIHSRAGTSRRGIFTAYHDALPTNCVADWVCAGCSSTGYPEYSLSRGAERGYRNLAVFLAACSFDCLFCQNWTFRQNTEALQPMKTPEDLARMVDPKTSCICFFGGDPSPQMPFALAAARMTRRRNPGQMLRICWETNGSMHPGLLERAVRLSLESGGCIKFDVKAFDENLHGALTGASNRQTLENLALAVEMTRNRPDPPPVIASTLMVPGYVGPEEVAKIAGYLSSLDPLIPYSLLAFHPDYLMDDIGTTEREWAEDCLAVATEEGLENIKLGNIHLLR